MNSTNRKLLAKVQEFCMSESFEAEFEAFAKEYSDVFRSSVDYKYNEGEHPVEFFEVYNDYLQRFEGKIEDFIREMGCSPKEFYAQCREVLDNDDYFGEHRFFIEALLATSEYETFFMLMQGEMRKYQRSNGK